MGGWGNAITCTFLLFSLPTRSSVRASTISSLLLTTGWTNSVLVTFTTRQPAFVHPAPSFIFITVLCCPCPSTSLAKHHYLGLYGDTDLTLLHPFVLFCPNQLDIVGGHTALILSKRVGANSNMALRSAAATAIAAASFLTSQAFAQDCPINNLEVDYPAPVAAPGWSYRLIENLFVKPRGLLFDTEGSLLVIDSGVGLVRVTFEDDGGDCLSVATKGTLVENEELNHGIELSEDGRTLYASTPDKVFSWDYNAVDGSISEANRTIVHNMTNSDHTTRTLLLSRKNPGWLLVSRGSQSNEDEEAADLDSGHSQIRAFNLSTIPETEDDNGYLYIDGRTIGWGLRNSVGVAEEPIHGGIYSVENSIDEITRRDQDIHEDNPGEELNYHGSLNDTRSPAPNYGYPFCFAIWGTGNFPDLDNLTTGDQFPMNEDSTLTDESCNGDYTPPRLSFQAHTAPLDIKFTPDGTEAFVSFHGSWNRDEPVGYRVSRIEFDGEGMPVADHSSRDAAIDVLTNPDLSNCPDECFRPAGLALDSQGRLWMTSDSTGELFVITRSDNNHRDGNEGNNEDDAGAHLLPPGLVAIGLTLAAVFASLMAF
jgi:glucose/arabinose dehydrogenase